MWAILGAAGPQKWYVQTRVQQQQQEEGEEEKALWALLAELAWRTGAGIVARTAGGMAHRGWHSGAHSWRHGAQGLA